MGWIKVAIPANDVTLLQQGAFMTAILKAARDERVRQKIRFHRVQVTDGSIEFFLESPLAELVEKTMFTGVPSGAPPVEAKLVEP